MFMSTKFSPFERLNCAICGLQTDVSLNIAYARGRAAGRKKGYYVAHTVTDDDNTVEKALSALEEYIDLNQLRNQVSEEQADGIIDRLIAAREARVKVLEVAPNSRFILKSTDPEDTTIFTLTNVCDGAACEFPMEIRFDHGAVTLVRIET